MYRYDSSLAEEKQIYVPLQSFKRSANLPLHTAALEADGAKAEHVDPARRTAAVERTFIVVIIM